MKPKYLVKNEREYKLLKNAYEKLEKYYYIQTDFGDLIIEKLESLSTTSKHITAKIYPSNPQAKIIELKRNNLEITLEEDYCKSCSPKHLENIQEIYAEIRITKTNYIIKFNHQHF